MKCTVGNKKNWGITKKEKITTFLKNKNVSKENWWNIHNEGKKKHLKMKKMKIMQRQAENVGKKNK